MTTAILCLVFAMACDRDPELQYRTPDIVTSVPTVEHLDYIRDRLGEVARGLTDSVVIMQERQARRTAEVYSVSDLVPDRYRALVVDTAKRHNVEPRHLAGLVTVESQWDPNALGTSGEIGLGQVMPDTAEDIAKARGIGTYDLRDPVTNLDFSAWFLSVLIEDVRRVYPRLTDQEVVEEALRWYNAGPAWRTWAEAAARGYSRRVLTAVGGDL